MNFPRDIRSSLLPLAGLAAAALTVIMFLVGMVLDSPARNSGGAVIDIRKGMNAGEIADLLKKKGIIRSAFLFRAVSCVEGYEGRYRFGRYTIPRKMRTFALARFMAETVPGPFDIKVTIPEGLNIWETASLFFRKAKVDSAAFVRFARNHAAAESMGVDNETLEGYLYPETYFVTEEADARDIIGKMVGQYRRVLSGSIQTRARTMKMTVNEVMTLASLIETEAANDTERPIISAVFHRRLKLRYPLQANPTIQYVIGEKRRVLDEDLAVDSPYNTYRYRGLPPGPIASPGLKSIIAALYPADTDYLYFVADGNGGHVFSRSLAEHRTAVSRYLNNRAHESR